MLASVVSATSLTAGATTKIEPEGEGEGETAEVHVSSDKPGTVVAEITGEAFAIGSSGATASAVAWKDICVAPCSFRTKPGLFNIIVHGSGHVAGRESFQLSPGANYLLAKPGSSGMRYGGYALVVVGIMAATFGLIYSALPTTKDYANCGTTTVDCPDKPEHSWPMPLLIGGLVATGVGVGMWIGSSTSIEQTAAPRGPTGATHVPVALTYSAAF
jgi:hypothetical protein